MAGIDQVLADAAATSPAVQLLDGDPDELENRWDALSPDIKGKIVDELITVTVLPTPRGVKGVNRRPGDRDRVKSTSTMCRSNRRCEHE